MESGITLSSLGGEIFFENVKSIRHGIGVRDGRLSFLHFS
jgi:hypothetical protein